MATRLSLIIALLSTVFFGNTQDLNCGTIPTDRDIQMLKSLKIESSLGKRNADGEPIKIAISAHIVRNSNSTGGLRVSELEAAIADVNEIYTLTNMEFFLFGDINYIDNDDYYNFNSADETALTSVHDIENTINVYFFNTATSGESSVCGYAYFPSSGIDHLIMVNNCTTNGSTFPHELGHYFALYHTHGKTNTGTTDELVDGSNCESAGDDICDTAADPNLSGQVNFECEYTGTGTDTNGDLYIPNPKNLMSYSQKHCRYEFSQGQANRISAAYQEYKTYLNDKTYAANFGAEKKEVCEGGSINFNNKSVGAVSYQWTFEGGTPSTSIEKDPIITYDQEGLYNVSLTITEEDGGQDLIESADFISVKSNVTSSITERNGGFEEANLEETIINDDDEITFEKNANAFTEGSNSIYINFLSYGNSGALDYLVLPALNTGVIKNFELTFDYAYAPYDADYFDGLAIVYRDPCGDWNTVWEKYGSDLQTAQAQTSQFIPTSNQWNSESIIINLPQDQVVTEVAFKAINGYGNQLYIDNYSIKELDESFEISQINVTDAACPDSNDGSISVDISGSGSFEYSLDGENYLSSNVISNLEVGIYEVHARNSSGNVKNETIEVSFINDYPETPNVSFQNNQLFVYLEENQVVQWYLNNEILEGEENSIIQNLQRGAYTAEVSNGACSTTSNPFTVLAIDEVNFQLKVYPNPAVDQLKISLPEALQKEIKGLSIRDLTGKVIKTFNYVDLVPVDDLKRGIYVLHLEVEDNIISRRFLKQ